MRGVAGAGTICVLAAAVLGGCASEADDAPAPSADGGPVVYEDHWHAAFGVYLCDAFLPDIPEFESPEGIHTHGDGVIHIHPFTDAGAGGNATLGLYLSGADMAVDDGELTVDGETHRDGDDCDGEPGRVQVVRWADVSSGVDTEDVTDRAADQRFSADGESYTVAFVPEGADVPPPPSLGLLDDLSVPEDPEAPPDEASGDDGTGDVAVVVDDRVVSAPIVQEAGFAADEISISGDFDEAEAESIAGSLTP